MASVTTTDINCGPCLYNNITVPGKVWCLSCEEGLCKSCTNSHKGIKATRNHKVIPAEKCHHVASIGHLMSQTCKNHNKVLDLYCPSHDAPVCSLCIAENHRECKDIVSLDEVAKNVVSSSSFCNLEHNVDNLLKNLSQLKTEREMNSKQLQNDKIAKITLVKEMRRQLNKSLDTLEEKLLQELSSKAGTSETEINNSLSEIESKTKAAYVVQSNISHLKEMATDVQLFLAIREIDKSVTTESNCLHEIINQHKMDELTLDLNTKPMEDMLKTNSLGSVRMERSPYTVQIKHPKMKVAQIPLETMRNKIDQIRLQQKTCIQYHTELSVQHLFGCMICSNGDIILTDGPSKKFAVFNEKGNHIKDISVPGIPNDITEISEDRIAVTYGNEEKFEIADIKDYNYKTAKSVCTTSTCCGISCDNGKLAVKRAFEEIHIYDINEQKIRNIRNDNIHNNFHHVTIFQGRIYFSNTSLNIVGSFDQLGNQLWIYGSYTLVSPTGITTDGYGNVYVVGRDSKNLFVISEDGQKERELFKYNATPLSVHFDNHNNQLLVRDCEGATVYDVVFDNRR